jgi:thiamine pyrophosphokinase
MAELLIGVDGGARTLRRHGLVPQLVTGDGDSLTEAERAELVLAGTQLVPTPDQDYTDLDKAVLYVRERYPTATITVFGATGGRLDHSYSVFSTLLKHGAYVPIQLLDETASYERVTGTWERTGTDLVGRTLSLLAFGRVEGITMTGVRWPLDNDWLAPGQRDGTLNEVISPTVKITVTTGELIVMLHHL